MTAKEGLLALAVGTGLQVMAAAEVLRNSGQPLSTRWGVQRIIYVSGGVPVRGQLSCGSGWGRVTSHEQEFVEFAEASAPRLRRAAFLLCGDWHTAEDLAQTALAKVFVSWRKVRRQDAAHAYATRTLVNCYLADKRLRRSTEILTDQLPDYPAPVLAPETRMVVLDALATLPPRSRAVVVLRYWTDLSVDQAADVLGCSPGTVKTLGARALGKLRGVLGDALTDPGPPRHPPGDPHQAKETWHG